MCRDIQLGVASAIIALENAHLGDKPEQRNRLGVLYGANLMLSSPDTLHEGVQACTPEQDKHKFEFNRWGQEGLNQVEPLWLLKYLPNMPACHIGIYADAQGPNNSLTLEDAAGNLAMAEAMRIIQRGQSDVMIVGCTGTRLHPTKSMHSVFWFDLAEPTDDPTKAYRPFDKNRTGQVSAEASGSFVLEDEQFAKERGADIYGCLLGTGSSCVISKEGKPDNKQAMINAMRGALRNANLKPEDIGSINAHGMGTKASDIEEAEAILEVFGEYGKKIPVTAIKSYIGNSGAGNSAVELAASILGLKEGLVPATLNYETPDPECPLNVVHGAPKEVSNKIVLSLNITQMAQAAAVIVEVV